MIIVSRVELDGKEIEHLRAISRIDCDKVKICTNCPLNLLIQDGIHVCLKSLVRMSINQNTIESDERSDNGAQTK